MPGKHSQSRLEIEARQAMAKHDLSPIENPRGEDHHTDAEFTPEDREIDELA